MGLVATVSQQNDRTQAQVDVWRLNGQRVFGASFGGDDDQEEEGEGEEDNRGDGEDGGDDDDGRIAGRRQYKVEGLSWRRDGEFALVFLIPFSRLLGGNSGRVAVSNSI